MANIRACMLPRKAYSSSHESMPSDCRRPCVLRHPMQLFPFQELTSIGFLPCQVLAVKRRSLRVDTDKESFDSKKSASAFDFLLGSPYAEGPSGALWIISCERICVAEAVLWAATTICIMWPGRSHRSWPPPPKGLASMMMGRLLNYRLPTREQHREQFVLIT